MREDVPLLRAFTPEPILRFEAARSVQAEVVLQNVHPGAALGGDVTATAEGPVRHIRASLAPEVAAEVRIRFPERSLYTFVAIGDTGGLAALGWALERAVALGADFLLHLGDLGYSEDAFLEAEATLAGAPIPVYAAIGNHDLEGPWTNPSDDFTRVVGPRNSRFTLAGVTFANLDTGADTLLPMRGARGRLLRALRAERTGDMATPLVVFTHRPLYDPRVIAGELAYRDAHALDRSWESSWLRETVLQLGAQALLAGHIHESHDFDDHGLPTWVSGEGLALADLENGEQVSRVLVGSWRTGEPVRFRWEPLRMPPELIIPR
jgi:3',5'-cyclic AMP phosphodiesterase CpdA